MSWKDFVPYAGNKTVRKRLNELDENAVSLIVIFSTFFTKVPEKTVEGDFRMAFMFGVFAILTGVLIVYMKPAKEKVEEELEERTE
jgi:hypothetical protein